MPRNKQLVTPSQSVSIFTLFSKTPHTVNWYVHRSPAIRKELKALWGDGPANKKMMDDMTPGQLIVTRTNALFRALEHNGPSPKSPEFKITLDTTHGKCNRTKEGCISKGFYHTHVTDQRNSFVVLWECFEDKKLINIITIGQHENFNFKLTTHDPLQAMEKAMIAAQKANFNSLQPFDANTYKNSK